MSLQATVTPGQVFSDGDPITSTELNNGANPTVEIPDGSITSPLLDLDEVVSAISPSLSTGNYLPWGSFQQERFSISGTVSVADGIRTPVHPGWYVLSAGAAVNVAAAARSSATESAEAGRCAVKVFGHASLSSVNVGTYLPPGLAQMIYSGNVTFSCYLWNNTGTTLTPALELYAGATAGDEGAVSLVGTVNASASCASGQWTRVEFDFDASGITNFAKGCHFRVKVTKATGIMDSGSDYILLADAQIDPGVTTATSLKRTVLPLDATPAGAGLPWFGAYNAVPPGWLFADGSAVSRARYAALFAALGTVHGAGDGSTTFNLPDCRGRTLMGAEIAGSSQGRAEVAVTVVSSSGDTLTVASGAAAGLRLGMGAFNGAALTGQTILALTDTTIQLSASVGTGISGTVYFSKLGAANPQTLGAAGAGLSGKRRKVTVVKANCSTASSTTLTVPGLRGLACGMTVSGSGIPAGTTVSAFLTATTLLLSAAATATASGVEVTFGVDAPEGDEAATYEKLRQNPVVRLTISTAADVSLASISAADWSVEDIIFAGMAVTCSNGSAGVVANTVATAIGSGSITISPATSGATNGNYEFQFSTGATQSREATAQAPPTPGMLGVNYIIKV